MSYNIAPKPLPVWLKIGGSIFAVWHVAAVALLAIGAPSGPWMHPRFGFVQADGPRFAAVVNNSFTYPLYLEPLRMSHNYHFESNRLQVPASYLEVHLKDELGKVTMVKIPDDKANFWVRHRQAVLAKSLANDLPPMQRDPTPKLLPAGQEEVKDVEVWEPGPNNIMTIALETRSDAQKKQSARPAPLSKVLAESYMRYLCKEHKAVSAELVRCTQPQPIPTWLFMPSIPPEDFAVLKHHFGEYRRD